MRTFSSPDFRPSAGFGKFDAYYWPAMSLMAVISKMKFNFVQADNTPSLAILMAMTKAGQDISRLLKTAYLFLPGYHTKSVDFQAGGHGANASITANWPIFPTSRQTNLTAPHY